MDFTLLFPTIATLFFAFVIYKLYTSPPNNHRNPKAKTAPQPPGAWPIIGHLHLLGGQTPLCVTLGAMADKYGPIFGIRLGVKQTLIVSNWEGVKDCFHTNDKVFLSRPTSYSSKYMGYDDAMFGFATYGPYWRQTRKIATLDLLSNRRLELLKHVRAVELDNGIKHLYSLCQASENGSTIVDMGEWFRHVSLNVFIKMIAGKRYGDGLKEESESQKFGKAIKEFMYLLFAVTDVIPLVERLDLQGYARAMKRNAKELDGFINGWLEEHLQRRRDGKVKEESDFIDVMLDQLADQEMVHGHKRETFVKATALNLIVGGVDSIALAITSGLALVMNHPEVLKKAQEELDIQVGRERRVEESDFKNLTYLQAIIKETLRLYPPTPLAPPRESLEECYVGGYYVPKGTRLIVNTWKLHRDSRVWSNPLAFEPERFLNTHANLDITGLDFEYVPFSSGRRSCPGRSLGWLMTSLLMARVLQAFNLATPNNKPVDLRDGTGVSVHDLVPVELVLTPRLPPQLYQVDGA